VKGFGQRPCQLIHRRGNILLLEVLHRDLVLVEEQTNVYLEEGNVDINIDDNNVSDPAHIFNSSHPNIYIVYQILFTLFVTVVYLKELFKVKVTEEPFKVYMLNGLTNICIKKKLLDEIDIETIIIDFSSRNARKIF
jgi:hypothetical protein